MKAPCEPHASVPASAREDALQFNRRGLFLGGCPKSGTTLLLSLLDSHPQLIVLPEETAYLQERRDYAALDGYHAKLRRLLEQTNLRLLAHGRFEPPREASSTDARDYTGFDFERFGSLANAFINQSWMNDSLLLSELIRAYAIVLGSDWRRCVRWVEKTPGNEIFCGVLRELFPDSRLIQLVRDPRAVFASRKRRLLHERVSYTKAHRLVRQWNQCARQIPRLLDCPNQFLVVRYEDLVSKPQSVLQQICRFAGLDFSPALLKPTRAGTDWHGNSSFRQNFHAVDTTPVDKWRDYLTEQEVWWIELHCRRGMELAGYPLQTDGRFSLSSWLRPLPGESPQGYVRARRASACQLAGCLADCRY
ncbi:MAG: sulfotransferase family protein [Limisphaerales bacterium]